jgi:hypothetical protein
MPIINRSALILRPRQPYVDWANSLPGPRFDPTDERAVYLAPEFVGPVEMRSWLVEAFDLLFQHELDSWHTDESDWPAPRDFTMFRRWFELEYDSVVVDLCDAPPAWDLELDPSPD